MASRSSQAPSYARMAAEGLAPLLFSCHTEVHALQHNAGEFPAFAERPAAQQHMEAWRHGHRELHLVFPRRRFDHRQRIFSDLRVALQELHGNCWVP